MHAVVNQPGIPTLSRAAGSRMFGPRTHPTYLPGLTHLPHLTHLPYPTYQTYQT